MLGTLHLRLTRAIGDPHIFEVSGLVQLVPQDELYTRGTVIDEGGVSIMTFSRPDVDPSAGLVFTVATTISADVANRMFEDPDWLVVFFTASGPAASGQLKLVPPPDPD